MISARLALYLARKNHEGQKRKHGADYIWHPVAVALNPIVMAAGEELVASALMHDLVEDTDVTLEELAQKGASPNQLRVVKALTKLPNESRVQYMKRIREFRGAAIVKLADSLHNYDELPVLLTLEGEPGNGETWQEMHDRMRAKYQLNVKELEEFIGVPLDRRTVFIEDRK